MSRLLKAVLFGRMSFAVILFTLTFSLLFSQIPDTLWTRTYGGVSEDKSYSVQQTDDGGYIIAGYFYQVGPGLRDVYLVKTDTNGDTLWTRIYGGHDDDIGRSVQQTSDGGYIIVGSTMSFGIGYCNVWLLKTDENGDTLWTRAYGGTNADNTGYSIQQTTDGGYIIAGWNMAHMLLIKTDEYGDTLWLRTYGTAGFSRAFSVQQTADGGYIMAGYYSRTGDYNFYLVKTDSLGDTLWTKEYGGPQYDRLYSIQQTSDGGYIAAGALNMMFGKNVPPDFCLLKTDTNGELMWMETYGGSKSDEGHSVVQTLHGEYVASGFAGSFGAGLDDIYVIKVDQDGDTLWTKILGGSGVERSHSVQTTTDGGYVIAGWTTSWGAGDCDVYIIKIAPDTFGIEENYIRKPRALSLDIFPNPFRKKADIRYRIADSGFQPAPPGGARPGIIDNSQKISLTIYDATGRLVKDFPCSTPNALSSMHIMWDGRDNLGKKLPSGVYFLRFEAGNYKETGKLILLR